MWERPPSAVRASEASRGGHIGPPRSRGDRAHTRRNDCPSLHPLPSQSSRSTRPQGVANLKKEAASNEGAESKARGPTDLGRRTADAAVPTRFICLAWLAGADEC